MHQLSIPLFPDTGGPKRVKHNKSTLKRVELVDKMYKELWQKGYRPDVIETVIEDRTGLKSTTIRHITQRLGHYKDIA